MKPQSRDQTQILQALFHISLNTEYMRNCEKILEQIYNFLNQLLKHMNSSQLDKQKLMSYSLPHHQISKLNQDIKVIIKDKILHFHEQSHSPAVAFLLQNMNRKVEQTKKHKAISSTKLKFSLLLPKLKDNNYIHSKSINNSVDSTINNTNTIDTSIQYDKISQINLQRLQNITSSSIISPKSNQQIIYLQDIESESKNQLKKSLLSASARKGVDLSHRRNETTKSISVSQVNKSIYSPSNRQSIQYTISINQGTNRFLVVPEHLAEFHQLKQKCHDDDQQVLLDFIESHQSTIIHNIKHKDYEMMIQIFGELLEICQDVNNVLIFSEIVYYLSCFCLDCDQTDKAIFFLEQTLIICEYSKNHKLKQYVLQQLAKCATLLQRYQQAIDLLKKSLVYVWINNDFESEILIYDQLGINYFYKGDIKQAIFYHEKYTLAEVEPQFGYFRKISFKYVNFYEEILQFFSERLNKTFMIKLSLPIKNKFELTPENTYPKCDKYKVIRYNTCDGLKIIEDILNGVEFTQYQLEYYQTVKRHIKQIIPEHKIQRERLPKRIIEIQQKYSDFKAKQAFSHNIYENQLYKVSLDMKVQQRVQSIVDIDKVWERVKRSNGASRQPYGEKKEQIYMKHLSDTKSQREDSSNFLKRHKKQINDIIASIII